jgi:hypothetical protein
MPIEPRRLTELLAAVGAKPIDDRADDVAATVTGMMAGASCGPSRAGDDGLVRGLMAVGLMALAAVSMVVRCGHGVGRLERDDFDRGWNGGGADDL